MPTVSVIIPSYNCAAFVAAAVDSVLSQTMHDCEALVVDDGSSDKTREVLEPYSNRPGFRYFHQENRGLPGARNAGVQQSDSKYVAFLDADDALAPQALASMTAALDASGANWCLIDIVKVLDDREEVRRTVLPSGDPLVETLRDDFIYRAMFFRRSSFVEIGMYDESMRYREDWELNIRMLEKKEPFVYLNRALYRYYMRQGSITTGNRAKVLDYTGKVLRKHHKRMADLGDRRIARIYARNMWVLGRQYFYETRDYRKALACIRESLAYDLNPSRVFHPLVHHLRRLRGSA